MLWFQIDKHAVVIHAVYSLNLLEVSPHSILMYIRPLHHRTVTGLMSELLHKFLQLPTDYLSGSHSSGGGCPAWAKWQGCDTAITWDSLNEGMS